MSRATWLGVGVAALVLPVFAWSWSSSPDGANGRNAAGGSTLIEAAPIAGSASGADNIAGSAGGPTTMTYRNPIVPGFHPDPSICRVGADYYLVHSSFEYFPGIPIFHSRDLVNWRQIGHVLTRDSQLPLADAKSSQGVFAPTIRHHQGKFYVITTSEPRQGSFVVTASDPAGPWSEPVWLESVWGMDPSLFFDDDGKVYFTRHAGGENGRIVQAEVDLGRGALVTPVREIWRGTGGVWPEGPHLYKVQGSYYLMIAEGGTAYDHSVMIARASAPDGPFRAFPGNPILTHRDRRSEPIQATGHADWVETPDGKWWLVFLGIRPTDGQHHHLGRETFLAPITWNAEGWPVVNGGQPIGLSMPAAGLPPPAPWPEENARDDFDGAALGFRWNFLRNPHAADWSLTSRPGFLRLNGTRISLDDIGSPAFAGRRQEHFAVRVRARLEFEPTAEGHEAGLTIRQNESNHYDLALQRDGGARRVELKTRIANEHATVGSVEVPPGPVTLRIDARANAYEFFVEQSGAEPKSLGSAPTAPLSSESASGFTGVYFGLYAWASFSLYAWVTGESVAPADFDWFEYVPMD